MIVCLFTIRIKVKENIVSGLSGLFGLFGRPGLFGTEVFYQARYYFGGFLSLVIYLLKCFHINIALVQSDVQVALHFRG